MLQIAVAGISGRMGQCLVQVIEASAHMEVSFGTEENEKHTAQDEKRYSVVHVKTLGDHDSFDVLIDFTTPHSCALHLDACLKASKPMVIGTTGLPATLIKQIKEASAKIPIMYAANMSIGVNLVYSLLELASRQLGKEWQVSISEIHHQYKQDAPSGTALEMGKVIETSSSVLRDCQYQSARLGNIPGEHSVIFATDDERIEISHKAQDRMIFARGAVKAAEWLVQQPPGCYTMKHVLEGTGSS